MDDQTLLAYFRRGLIPGPDESEDVFLQRVEKSISLNHPEWTTVAHKTLSRFGWAVDWMPITYSNHKLAWWEGAATWISDHPSIQLRNGFQKGSYLGYALSDVLAHEAIHAARIKFEEPLFEEMVAYSIAPQRWKQFFGPIFCRSWEPLLFLLALVAGGFWLWVPIVAMACWAGWLVYRQSMFKRCCRILSMPVVLCLTDSEIKRFSRGGDFNDYLKTESTLRFQMLRLVFLRKRDQD